MPAKPFKIETRTFPRKEDAKAFFREILNRYGPGDRVSDVDARELRALLKLHTDYENKLRAGISHFEVMKNKFDTQSFKIIYADGTDPDDFSFIHCITPKKR